MPGIPSVVLLNIYYKENGLPQKSFSSFMSGQKSVSLARLRHASHQYCVYAFDHLCCRDLRHDYTLPSIQHSILDIYFISKGPVLPLCQCSIFVIRPSLWWSRPIRCADQFAGIRRLWCSGAVPAPAVSNQPGRCPWCTQYVVHLGCLPASPALLPCLRCPWHTSHVEIAGSKMLWRQFNPFRSAFLQRASPCCIGTGGISDSWKQCPQSNHASITLCYRLGDIILQPVPPCVLVQESAEWLTDLRELQQEFSETC